MLLLTDCFIVDCPTDFGFLRIAKFVYVPDVIRFASVYHNNTKLDASCHLLPDWATTTRGLLGPTMGAKAVSVFPKNTTIQRTQRCPVYKPKLESTTLRLSTCCILIY